ncbi:hypothetical protein [Clostridium estertheticum]|uniref:hypothetical protein n=1 Tax=Clostridium estertheticum TaxID=238834 RepID=UPI001C7E0EC0|nr:hypothetical protein [Clostridium estertheticum]MBX4264151.1 hypothetical protein [Clostridium estertheticum]WLC87249.1 hypothetical protein KTC95_13915 [Clostridium estertheticum]
MPFRNSSFEKSNAKDMYHMCSLSAKRFLYAKKVYITYNALKQALELLILFLIKMRKKNICLSAASLCFLAD